MSIQDEINKQLEQLKYEPNEVLAFDGNTVSSLVPKEGTMSGNSFTVITRTKQSLGNEYNVAVPNAYMNVTYAGGLLLANGKLIDGA